MAHERAKTPVSSLGQLAGAGPDDNTWCSHDWSVHWARLGSLLELLRRAPCRQCAECRRPLGCRHREPRG
eukprot:10702511-Alexandrium_andersonii.AAC.1